MSNRKKNTTVANLPDVIAEEASLVKKAFEDGKMDNEELDPPDVVPVDDVKAGD